MSEFLLVIGIIVWIAALAFIVVGCAMLVSDFAEFDEWLKAGAALIAAVCVFAAVICIPFWFGWFDEDDNSQHCGPGTEFRESSQYNPATKTSDYSWWCEAR